MAIKEGVCIAGIRPECVLAIEEARAVFAEHGKAFVLTSALDGQHRKDSLHYKGLAFDCRIRHLTAEQTDAIAGELARRLGRIFDVVRESDHLHVEFDPK